MSISNTKMVLLVGPSGSGKTTYLNSLSEDTYMVLSDDRLKFAFYLIDSDKEFNLEDTPIARYTKVWEHAQKRNLQFQEYLNKRAELFFKEVNEKNKILYIDNTNLSPRVREPWIKLARSYNMPIHAIEFWIDSDVLYQRQSSRLDKHIPSLHLKQQIRAQTHCGIGTEVDSVELITS